MEGEVNLKNILKNLNPLLNEGKYVYCTVDNIDNIPFSKILFLFKETESITVVLKKEDAEALNLDFSYVASWITLEVHSSLAAVGLTAKFSQALSEAGISCNVVAAYFHDHIFVDEKDEAKAIEVLNGLRG
ncbi:MULTISPECIES: ACT domain-containing protein [unclassified Chryseobacterium]|uniref:ACT domain-containing protein n=1 Tax=unclassified Chryseobacterium TaxID=2593645 RepID=UPI00100AAFD8|nr:MULTISPECIES: ACT domain-containing protein [unclassified Chryseobacterium]RXM52616.1 acetyltransferase [Chryseobacterium sp. CH25]RXM66671.1 acetyltransferase [Chryseobacterium sp. CH1]